MTSEFFTIEANDGIPVSCKYPLATIQAAKSKTQTNTGSLRKLFKLKLVQK